MDVAALTRPMTNVLPRILCAASTPRDVYIVDGTPDIYGSPPHANEVYRYSVDKNTLTVLQCSGDKPSERRGSGVIIGQFLVFVLSPSQYNHVYVLNLASYRWTRLPNPKQGPAAQAFGELVTVGKMLLLFGQDGDYKSAQKLWALDFNETTTFPTWKLIEPSSKEKPIGRKSQNCVAYKDQLIILGGETKDDKGMIMGLRDIWSFSMTTRRWTKLQCNIPEDFPFFASAAIVDDIIYLYRSTWFGALQLSTQKWVKLDNKLPNNLPAISEMARVGSKLFVFDAISIKHIHVLDTGISSTATPLPSDDAQYSYNSPDNWSLNLPRYNIHRPAIIQPLDPQQNMGAPTGDPRARYNPNIQSESDNEAQGRRDLEAEVERLRKKLEKLEGGPDGFDHVPLGAGTSSKATPTTSLPSDDAQFNADNWSRHGNNTQPQYNPNIQPSESNKAYLESGRYEICNIGGKGLGLGYARWDEHRSVTELRCSENNHRSGMQWKIDFNGEDHTFTIRPFVGGNSQWFLERQPLVGYEGSPHISRLVLAWQTINAGPKKRWYATRAEGQDEYFICSVRRKLACTVANDTDGNNDYLPVTLQVLDEPNRFQRWKLQYLDL